jgi:flavin-dependent dehydrogenase
MKYKVAVVGGGPSGACAAEIFAQEKGIDTVLFERKLDNAKPCGGAIPLCMVGEFDLPESVVDRKVRSSPSFLPCRAIKPKLETGIWANSYFIHSQIGFLPCWATP